MSVGANNSHHSASLFLPPSDAAISSSIDRPQVGAEVAGVESGVAAADIRGKEGIRVEAGSVGVAAGKGTPDHLGGTTPRGERRRRGEGGRGERGGMACGVEDADIASGLARRGRLGGPSLGIVGIRSFITFEDQ